MTQLQHLRAHAWVPPQCLGPLVGASSGSSPPSPEFIFKAAFKSRKEICSGWMNFASEQHASEGTSCMTCAGLLGAASAHTTVEKEAGGKKKAQNTSCGWQVISVEG